MKILDKIWSLEFSEAERDRIEKHLLDDASPHHKILASRASTIREPDFWRKKQKRNHVTGFRDGHPKAIQMVLSRTLESVRKHSWRDTNSAWPTLISIYARTFQLYLHDELNSLSDLLRKEEYKDSFGSTTDQIFRSIVRCLPLYEADIGHVRKLYELWGFDRSERITEILASSYIDVDGVRRIVDDRMSTVRREIANAVSTSSSDVLQRLELQRNEVNALTETVIRLRHEVADRLVGSPSNLTVQSDPQTAVTDSDRPRQPSEIPRQIRRQDIQTNNALRSLQVRVESLGRQLKELKIQADANEKWPRTGKQHSIDTSNSGSSVSALLSQWSASFQNFGLSSPSIGAKWIVLELVRRSRVVVTDKPRLFTDLYDALSGSDIRTITVAPHWVSVDDWSDAHAFIAENSGTPRLLVVLDFDVSLQDTYLVPALSTLRATLPTHCSNRFVLIPSDMSLQSVTPRVFEFASFITHDAPYIGDLGRIGATILDTPPTLELPQTGNALLGLADSKVPTSEDELRQYAENFGVHLPTRVLENYINTYEGLRTSLSMRDAGFVTRESTLLPWIERSKGVSLARVMREALDRLEGA